MEVYINMFGSSDKSNAIMLILVYAIIIGGLYFMLFRPQKKKQKQEEEMRNNLKIGDEITTIGGIVGKIVNIKDDSDSIVIETGSDRNKMRIKKWAVGSNNSIANDKN